MAKLYIVRITGGTSDGPYNIYHTVINSNNLATDVSNNLPASGLSYNYLAIGTGVTISVPDNATGIIVYNVDCNIYSGNTVLSPIVDLTVEYEGCSNGGDLSGRFIFRLSNPLGDNLTINESTLSFQNNLPLTVQENSTKYTATPILPITLTAGTLTGITMATTPNDFPYYTSKFISADIKYNNLLYTGGTQWTMPNGQIVQWFTANNPQLNVDFEPDYGYDNTFCLTPTPTPGPTSTPTPTPSPSPNPTSTPTPTPSSTPLPTINLTRAPLPRFSISNYASSGRIDDVQGLTGIFYTIDGDLPVLAGQTVQGTQAGYSNSIIITVFGPSVGGCLSIAINGTETHSENVPAGVVSTLTFTNAEYGGFTSSDRVEIRLQNFNC